MANPSKDKGTFWETAVVNWLKENGFPNAKRNTLGGKFDPGDIEPIPAERPLIVISAKYGYAKDVHPQTKLFDEWWGNLQNTLDRRSPDGYGMICHHRYGKSSPEYAHWYGYDPFLGVVKVTGPQALEIMARLACFWEE